MKKKKIVEEIKGTVTVINQDRLVENLPFKDETEAYSIFLEFCKNYLSNFDEYTQKDIDAILKDGIERFGHGEIRIWWF